MSDAYWMQQAYDQAKLALVAGEVPVGAVLVSPEGQCLAQSYNHVMTDLDPTAHAEVRVIQAAAQQLKAARLVDCTLYVTLEPCVMCAGAIVQARLKRLVFATRDLNAGAAGSVFHLLCGHPLNHAVIVDEGIMQVESASILNDFFKARR